VDLTQGQYERLHDFGCCEGMNARSGFGILRVGAAEGGFDLEQTLDRRFVRHVCHHHDVAGHLAGGRRKAWDRVT